MNRLPTLLLALLFTTVLHAAPQPDDAPRVLIISIDGLRPDLALRADTPTIHALMKEGSFTFWARSTALSITLPSHTSMVTGVNPRKHEIEWNKELELAKPVYPNFPTLMEIAHKHGYTTAMSCGKSKFDVLAKPGTLDWVYMPTIAHGEDGPVVEHAVAMIHEHKPQVLFVHLPTVDNVGHAKGWGSPEQVAAIAKADENVGKILAALAEEKLREKTLIILNADHGGAGRHHGPEDERSRNIPWIAVGPGVRKGIDLTTYSDLTVHIEDTFATCAAWLKLPLDKRLDGKPVKEIFEAAGELLEKK